MVVSACFGSEQKDCLELDKWTNDSDSTSDRNVDTQIDIFKSRFWGNFGIH